VAANGMVWQITEPLEPVLIITKALATQSKAGAGGARKALVCLGEQELLTVMPEVPTLRFFVCLNVCVGVRVRAAVGVSVSVSASVCVCVSVCVRACVQ